MGALVVGHFGCNGGVRAEKQDPAPHSDANLDLAVLARDMPRYGRNMAFRPVWASTQVGCRHAVVLVALGGAAAVDAQLGCRHAMHPEGRLGSRHSALARVPLPVSRLDLPSGALVGCRFVRTGRSDLASKDYRRVWAGRVGPVKVVPSRTYNQRYLGGHVAQAGCRHATVVLALRGAAFLDAQLGLNLVDRATTG